MFLLLVPTVVLVVFLVPTLALVLVLVPALLLDFILYLEESKSLQGLLDDGAALLRDYLRAAGTNFKKIF